MTSKKSAQTIANFILKKKGTDIKLFDLKKLTTITDYFVICSASSEIHAKAIADFIMEEMKKKGLKVWHNEGYNNLSWILLDYVDVVVHIFLEETRRFYTLDGLWADADITEIKD